MKPLVHSQVSTDEWYTPPYILDALGPFDDDPALPGKTDGLEREWHGLVWLNPPYSNAKDWMAKLATHGNGIALVFARTETKWFRASVWERADAVRFIYSRVTFLKRGVPHKGTPLPSVFVAYGPEAVNRVKHCTIPGAMIHGWDA